MDHTRQRVVYIEGEAPDTWVAMFISAAEGNPPMMIVQTKERRWYQPMLLGFDSPLPYNTNIAGMLMMAVRDLQADPDEPTWIPMPRSRERRGDCSPANAEASASAATDSLGAMLGILGRCEPA